MPYSWNLSLLHTLPTWKFYPWTYHKNNQNYYACVCLCWASIWIFLLNKYKESKKLFFFQNPVYWQLQAGIAWFTYLTLNKIMAFCRPWMTTPLLLLQSSSPTMMDNFVCSAVVLINLSYFVMLNWWVLFFTNDFSENGT